MGQLPVFIDFLKTSGLWDGLVADCPLQYTSPNAPSQVDILGTLLMSVLAGQRRYAHITGLRGDGVNPELLGMRKVMSENSARRAFKQAAPEATREWLSKHLRQTYERLCQLARSIKRQSSNLARSRAVACTPDQARAEAPVTSFQTRNLLLRSCR